jgi:hypothetical protein
MALFSSVRTAFSINVAEPRGRNRPDLTSPSRDHDRTEAPTLCDVWAFLDADPRRERNDFKLCRIVLNRIATTTTTATTIQTTSGLMRDLPTEFF